MSVLKLMLGLCARRRGAGIREFFCPRGGTISPTFVGTALAGGAARYYIMEQEARVAEWQTQQT